MKKKNKKRHDQEQSNTVEKTKQSIFFISKWEREREIHSNTSNLIMKKAEEEEEVKRDMKNE